MRIAVILAALLLSAPAYAWFWGDPAISVCEAVIASQIATPKSYERVTADVSGQTVLVTFDAVNHYNAPIRTDYECLFIPNAEGDFIISLKDISTGTAELNNIGALLDAARTERERLMLSIQREALMQELMKNSSEVAKIHKALLTTTGYPIASSKTSLSFTLTPNEPSALSKRLEEQQDRECPIVIDSYSKFRRGTNPMPPTPYKTTVEFKADVEVCAAWISSRSNKRFIISETSVFEFED
ncbi:hypothetical protein G3A39_41425 [Paraburkholderia aspalathi]|nr:hypothetical protein [Paraburkholderia aspalathi]